MKKNNFDKSSSGVNIELFLNYNIDLSQINFDDNFKLIEDSFLFYKDFGNMKLNENLDYYFNINNTIKNKKKLLTILNYNNYFDYYHLDYDVNNLLCEIIRYIGISLKNMEDLDNLLVKNYVKFSTNFEYTEITGYSQSDFCKILVDTKQFKEVVGVDFDSKVYRHIFKNYCYDSPLSCCAIINNKEYYPETLDGQYIEFDKEIFIDDIIKQVKNIDVELLTKGLEKLVPEKIGY